MRQRKHHRLGLTTCGLLLVGCGSASDPAIDDGNATLATAARSRGYFRLSDDISVCGKGSEDLITTPAPGVALLAGQSMYVAAKAVNIIDADSREDKNSLFGMSIYCWPDSVAEPDGDGNRGKVARTTRNYLAGLAFDADTRAIYTAQVDADVRCKLVGYTAKDGVCLNWHGDSSSGSYLYIGSTKDRGKAIGWWPDRTDTDHHVFATLDPPTTCANECSERSECDRKCDDADCVDTCLARCQIRCDTGVQIGPGMAAGNQEYLMGGGMRFPRASATAVRLFADVEVTTCYDRTGSCPWYAWSGTKGERSVVETRLKVYQYDGTNDIIATSFFPSTGLKSTFVADAVHHQTIRHGLYDVILHADAERVSAKLYVKRASGNTIRVETNVPNLPYCFAGMWLRD